MHSANKQVPIQLDMQQLDMQRLGFERAQTAGKGRPDYDPRALLKLHLYGYLHQIRVSAHPEA